MKRKMLYCSGYSEEVVFGDFDKGLCSKGKMEKLRKWVAIVRNAVLIYWIMGLLVVPCVIFAVPPLVLEEGGEIYPLHRHVDLLEDEGKKWTIQDISSKEFTAKFSPYTQRGLNLVGAESAYWVRIKIVNNQSQPKEWLLEISGFPSSIDLVELFIPERAGSFAIKRAGLRFPFDQREIEHRYYLFRFSPKPSQNTDIYLRFETNFQLLAFLTLYSPQNFLETDHDRQTITWIYYGIMLAMILYNLFIFFSLRDPGYLYYVLYITFFTLYQMSLNGINYEYFWPNSPNWDYNSVLIFTGLSFIWVIKFSTNLLQTKINTPRLHRLFVLLFWFIIGLMLFILFIPPIIGDYLIKTFFYFYFVSIIFSSFICLRKGYRPARFFFLAWFFFIFGIVIYGLATFDLIPFNIFTQHSTQFGTALEAILLSFALAERINLLKEEKSLAQAEALENKEIALQAMQRTDKLKDEFLSNTSHELKTPLNGIIGMAQSLVDGAKGKLPRSILSDLSLIVSSGRRLFLLVNDILDFSKLKHRDIVLQRRPLDIKQTADLVIFFCQPLLAGKDVELINEIGKDVLNSGNDKNSSQSLEKLPLVDADENRLIQILYNLIGNALKFTRQGKITISARQEGAWLRISITDTGIGIPADRLENIFQPFEQADGSISREFGGVGIGLSITKNLVKLHGGEIEVQSVEGLGSCFSFTIPTTGEQKDADVSASPALQGLTPPVSEIFVPAAEDLSAVKPEEPPDQSPDEKKIVLVVDDDPVNVRVLQNLLSLENYEVLPANDGFGALEIVDENSPDLVILDLMMPRMNGYEVCEKIRQTHDAFTLPVIILTARNQMEDFLKSMRSGANDYLTKPFFKEELLARVKVHLKVKETSRLKSEILRRQEVEAKLKAFQHQLFQMLDMADEAIVTVNENLDVTFFNFKAQNLFQLKKEEILAKTLDLIVPGDFAETCRNTFKNPDKPGEANPLPEQPGCELELRRKDGERFTAVAFWAFLSYENDQGLVILLSELKPLSLYQEKLFDNKPEEIPGQDRFDWDVFSSRGGPGFSLAPEEIKQTGFGNPSKGTVQQRLNASQKKLQILENAVHSVFNLLQGGKETIEDLRELSHVLERTGRLLPANDSSTSKLREKIVRIMTLSLQYWERSTQNSKIELAEQSGIWRVYLDRSTFQTRTLDKYLSLKTLPKRPRLDDVIKTAHFVLIQCPSY